MRSCRGNPGDNRLNRREQEGKVRLTGLKSDFKLNETGRWEFFQLLNIHTVISLIKRRQKEKQHHRRSPE